MSFDRDLERWETGAMSDDELVRSHPGEDVDGLLALHERMIAAAEGPVALDEGALQRFLGRLPDRARPRRRYRSVLLAVAAVLLTASMAVAVPGVHQGVTALTHGVGRLLGIAPSTPTQPAPSDPPATPPGNDATSDHSGGSGGTDEHPVGGRDGGGAGNEGDEGQDQQSDGGSGGEGDQGQDQQSDGNSGGSGDGGSESSGSSSGSGSDSASAGDHEGDGSGGDTQPPSSDGAGEQ